MFLSVMLGMAISIIALPIIGQIVELICSGISVLQLKNQKKMAQLQLEMEQLVGEDNTDATNPIGFQIPTGEDIIDYDDE